MTITLELTSGHIATNPGEYDEPPAVDTIELAGQDIPYTAKVWNKAEEFVAALLEQSKDMKPQ